MEQFDVIIVGSGLAGLTAAIELSEHPEQQTPIKGLVLAGDYTRQPFFATMEGAVISGENAAALIFKE